PLFLFYTSRDHQYLLSFPTRRSSDLINIVEIKKPELDAKLVGESIAQQLENRVAFRRAQKQAIQRTMKSGAKGIKVKISGRLNGDRKSTRLNSSHVSISYAVFCLKKK